MGRWTRIGDLKIVVEVSLGDVDLSTAIERLDTRLVKWDDEVGKELINELRVV